MVICKYFQHGNCRFGTKCNNEHFDVKQIIKTDLESAFNGKQWPFSSYGPFKDRPCVPNFIDDQSVEEVRWRFYGLQKTNHPIDQYLQQFNMDMATATNKMKMLLQLTPDVVEIITQLYDMPSDMNGSIKPNNPFGFAQSQNSDPNVGGGGGSFFNKPATTTNATTGNIFGGSFSSAPNNTVVAAGNIFGGNTNVGGTTNIFNTTATNNNNNSQSVFGHFQSSQSSTVMSTGAGGGNLFTSVMQQPNIFTQAAAQFPQQQMQPQLQQQSNGNNIFAQAAQQFPSNQQGQAPQLPLQQTTGFFQTSHPQQVMQQSALQQQQQIPLLPSPVTANNNVDILYSRIEDLTAEEIEAFKSDAFVPGQIPCVPPPKELIN